MPWPSDAMWLVLPSPTAGKKDIDPRQNSLSFPWFLSFPPQVQVSRSVQLVRPTAILSLIRWNLATAVAGCSKPLRPHYKRQLFHRELLSLRHKAVSRILQATTSRLVRTVLVSRPPRTNAGSVATLSLSPLSPLNLNTTTGPSARHPSVEHAGAPSATIPVASRLVPPPPLLHSVRDRFSIR